MRVLTFTVPGVPTPKGSFRAYTYTRPAHKGGGVGARATNDNPATTSWQSRVAFAAHLARGPQPAAATTLTGGVDVFVTFHMPRPKSLSKRYAGPHLKKPDLDKLLRAVCDGLKGVLYTDDAQVGHLDGWKHYAAVGEAPRAEIRVTSFAAATTPARERHDGPTT